MSSSTPLFSRCPLGCNAEIEVTDIVLPEGALHRCTTCGQLLSACDREWFDTSMQEFNSPEGTLPEGKAESRHVQRISRTLLTAAQRLGFKPEQARHLDVGCSSGSVLAVSRDLGFRCQGVEPAPEAAATAQKQGLEVFQGYLQEAGFPDNHFDIVTLFEVIEHLTEPLDLISEIRRILKPGGLLLIGTGNADSWTVKYLGSRWEYFDIRLHGGHISFFTPKSMHLLADHCGLQVADIETKRVNLAERKDVSPLAYQFTKAARELLALPARWLNKGHDMLVTLQKPQ